jgi:hypothetical protein
MPTVEGRMMRILGQITARLLGQYGEESDGWDPPRGGGKPSKDAVKGSKGYKVGRGEGRKKE